MSATAFWTLWRDADGFYLALDDGSVQRLDGNGTLLSVAWALGMPGPTSAPAVTRLLAEKEKAEIEAIDFLAVRIGARGPRW